MAYTVKNPAAHGRANAFEQNINFGVRKSAMKMGPYACIFWLRRRAGTPALRGKLKLKLRAGGDARVTAICVWPAAYAVS